MPSEGFQLDSALGPGWCPKMTKMTVTYFKLTKTKCLRFGFLEWDESG